MISDPAPSTVIEMRSCATGADRGEADWVDAIVAEDKAIPIAASMVRARMTFSLLQSL